MLVFAKGAEVFLHATAAARIWWNFVSSSKERIERAKRDWEEGRFPKIPGDEAEFIPLPDQDATRA